MIPFMSRNARTALTSLMAIAALAAPGATVAAAGPLDEMARAVGCETGHDGLRCSLSQPEPASGAKKKRLCRRGGSDARSCLSRGHSLPPTPAGQTR